MEDSPRGLKSRDSGKIWRRVSPKGGGWITSGTRIAFFRAGEQVVLPYATYRLGHGRFEHIAKDTIEEGVEFELVA